MSSGQLPWPQRGPGREGDTAGCFLSILHLLAPLSVLPTPIWAQEVGLHGLHVQVP